MSSQQDDMERRNLHVAPGWNELAVGTFCDDCGTRLVGDRGDAHPCPMGCEDQPQALILCASSGGRSIGAGHICACNRPSAHPLDDARPHGCPCGAMWACADCETADEVFGCAECGANP